MPKALEFIIRSCDHDLRKDKNIDKTLVLYFFHSIILLFFILDSDHFFYNQIICSNQHVHICYKEAQVKRSKNV